MAVAGNPGLQRIRRGLCKYRRQRIIGLDARGKSRAVHERIAFLLWSGSLPFPLPGGAGDRGGWRVSLGLLGIGSLCRAGGPAHADHGRKPQACPGTWQAGGPELTRSHFKSAGHLSHVVPVLLCQCRNHLRRVDIYLCIYTQSGQCRRGSLSDLRFLGGIYHRTADLHPRGHTLHAQAGYPDSLIRLPDHPGPGNHLFGFQHGAMVDGNRTGLLYGTHLANRIHPGGTIHRTDRQNNWGDPVGR